MDLILQLKLEAINKTMKKLDENTTQTTPPAGGAEPTEKETTTSTEEITLARLQMENEQLRTTIRLNEARRKISGELERAGARSPLLLFDSVKGDLRFTEDGSLANAEAIVKRLMKQFPEQFGKEPIRESIDGGAGRAAAPALTKEALAKMTPAEIAKLDWAAVREVLAS